MTLKTLFKCCIFILILPTLSIGAEIKSGDTEATVLSTLGQPQSQLNAGRKKILNYENYSITIANGVVAKVSKKSPRPDVPKTPSKAKQLPKKKVNKSAKSSNLVTITESTYNMYMQNNVVVVDFWAAWCGPCIKMKPRFAEASNSFVGQAIFGAVDIDANEALAKKLKIKSIPTIMIFKKGKRVDTITGLTSVEKLTNRVKKAIAQKGF